MGLGVRLCCSGFGFELCVCVMLGVFVGGLWLEDFTALSWFCFRLSNSVSMFVLPWTKGSLLRSKCAKILKLFLLIVYLTVGARFEFVSVFIMSMGPILSSMFVSFVCLMLEDMI